MGLRRPPLRPLRVSRPVASRGPGRFKDVALRLRSKRKTPPKPEAKLVEKPLFCGGVSGPLSSSGGDGWEVTLNDELRRSFVSTFRPAIDSKLLKQWFTELETKLKWERPTVGQRRIPRHAAWLTADGCSCKYTYGGTSWTPMPMEQWFLDITDSVCQTCGIKTRPNSCNANLYEDGSQTVGWHADDEPLFRATEADALILSLSLGATRTFEMSPNDDPENVTRLVLEDGDICAMEGLMQKHYRHRVPPERHIKHPRINLTWRWIVEHEEGCSRRGKEAEEQKVSADAKAWSSRGGRRQLPEGVRKPVVASARRKPRELTLEDKKEMEQQASRMKRFFGGMGVSLRSSSSATARGASAASGPRQRYGAAGKPDTIVWSPEEKEARLRREKRFGTVRSEEEEGAKQRREKRLADTTPAAAAAGADSAKRAATAEELAEEEQKRIKRAKRFGLADAASASATTTAPGSKVANGKIDKVAKAADVKLKVESSEDKEEMERRAARLARFAAPVAGQTPAAGEKSQDASKVGDASAQSEAVTPAKPDTEAKPADGGVSEAEKRRLRVERFGT